MYGVWRLGGRISLVQSLAPVQSPIARVSWNNGHSRHSWLRYFKKERKTSVNLKTAPLDGALCFYVNDTRKCALTKGENK